MPNTLALIHWSALASALAFATEDSIFGTKCPLLTAFVFFALSLSACVTFLPDGIILGIEFVCPQTSVPKSFRLCQRGLSGVCRPATR